MLYNRAQYDSVIQIYVPEFIKKNPQEEGLARYFLAESYYIKAIFESNPEKDISFLEQAWNEFDKALKCSDLQSNFIEYYYSCKYKMGWCSYRMAELNDESRDKLQRAYAEFMDVHPEAPDSIRIQSRFMAAESKVKEKLSKMYEIFERELNSGEINEIINSYAMIKDVYDSILNYLPTRAAPSDINELQATARIKKQLLNYYLGKLYQTISPETFDLVADANKKSDATQTALFYFTNLNYNSLLLDYPSLNKNYDTILSYLELIKKLNQYVLTSHEQTKDEFITKWDEIGEIEFVAERMFRRGNLSQSHPDIESVDFNEQTISFYDSSTSIIESIYWLGYIQMIQNENENSRKNLLKFISQGNINVSYRQKILLADAKVRKFLLDFEFFYLSNNFQKLKKLKEDVNQFLPNSMLIQKRKNLLTLLVNCSLTNNTVLIWSEILTGSDNEKLEQVFNAIMFILPRAALNIGTTREKYIILLNRLFEITNVRRSNETSFFRGIVKTLEAEIQANPTDKILKFKQAAEIFDSINSEYVYISEADYIKARCLFFADEFSQAKVIFQNLINQQSNLRALFYLAEIYRLSDQGLAAKKCYSVIIDKLQRSGNQHNEYWLVNAKAGLSSADESGELEILNSINIDSVEFQPSSQSNGLTYEKLANEIYLKQQYARESVEWLMKFGFPQKEIYPSKYRLNNSIFVAENIFQNSPFQLNEIRGLITSTLNLTVYLPENVNSETEVKFGEEILDGQNGIYKRRSIPLNSEFNVYVRNADCYELKETLKLANAGENKKVIFLSKKIKYSEIQTTKEISGDFESAFSSRWDGNYVLNKETGKLNPDSEFKNDFSKLYELRDFAIDNVSNRILAINAFENSIWIYANIASGIRAGTMQLNLINNLNSPEGIAVDSMGQIFVSDWANHRIVQLTNNGEFVQETGSFGVNSLQNVGQPIKLVFPTRLSVVEDHEGIKIDGVNIFREKYIFIADQNGIHVCNMNGDFLGTPLSVNNHFHQGSFYGFVVENYGKESRLYLVNRHRDSDNRIFGFLAN